MRRGSYTSPVSTQAFKATDSHIDPQVILLSYFLGDCMQDGIYCTSYASHAIEKPINELGIQPTMWKGRICCKLINHKTPTLLLSSMSALFPTSILLTLSDACCSMLRIQFLMSEQKEMDQLHKELKEIELNAIAQKRKRHHNWHNNHQL